MAGREQRRRSFRAAVAVAALHVGVVLLLLSATRPRPTLESVLSDSAHEFEVMLMPPSPARATSSGNLAHREHATTAANSNGSATTARPVPRPETSQPRAPAATDEPDHATTAPIDWAAELDRAARQAVPDSQSPSARGFGHPHRGTPPPTPPEFGWDVAHTNRVESIPGGGLLMHLSDRCIVVLAPLPFAFCSPTKPPANGGLFDHLHDAQENPAAQAVP